jgi:oxygen-independent coproporphyrinogen-3 oxidase
MAGSVARGPRNRIAQVLDAELVELELRAARLRAQHARGQAPPLSSVYLGGGTPSLMTPEQVAHLLAGIHEHLGLADDAEVTLEANPGPDELGDLAGFRAAGVDRLSIGAQSLDAAELRRLGRRHGPHDVLAAIDGARAAGFESISLDLLTDIPGQSMETWRRTLELALRAEPDHLSVYTLALDDPDAEGLTGSGGDHLPLGHGARAWRDRARPEQSEEQAAEMELLADELAAQAGLRRYEIANLAAPGKECRHNRLYWRRRPFLGIGPGAHGFDGDRTRSWNAARLDDYVASLGVGRLPPGGRDVVDGPTALAETAILGLRLAEGIEARLAEQPGIAPGLAWARLEGLAEDVPGLAEDVPGRVRLTQRGRLLADEVFARLLPRPRVRNVTRIGPVTPPAPPVPVIGAAEVA